MTTTPKRRRLQFGLRGLLVGVTVLAVPLGWTTYQLSWLRERRAVVSRSDIEAWGGMARKPMPVAPWSLRVFGAYSYRTVLLVIVDESRAAEYGEGEADDAWLTEQERREVERFRRLFPEAKAFAWFSATPASIDSTGNLHLEFKQ
jgi:hypothetical protein